jgi:hypothetical protein
MLEYVGPKLPHELPVLVVDLDLVSGGPGKQKIMKEKVANLAQIWPEML